MCTNKLNYRLLLVAAAVLVFAACKKECKQGEVLQGKRCVDTTTTVIPIDSNLIYHEIYRNLQTDSSNAANKVNQTIDSIKAQPMGGRWTTVYSNKGGPENQTTSNFLIVVNVSKETSMYYAETYGNTPSWQPYIIYFNDNVEACNIYLSLLPTVEIARNNYFRTQK